MASPANQNPPPGPPYDNNNLSKFFTPSPPPPLNPNFPVTTTTSHPTASPFHHPYYTAASSSPQPIPETTAMHPHRSISFPTPPLQPPLQYQSPTNPNAGARLMALLSAPASVLEAPGVNSTGSDYSMPNTIGISQTTSAGSDFVIPKNMVVGGANLGISHTSGGVGGGNAGISHTSGGGNLGISQNIVGVGGGGVNLGISHSGPVRMTSSKMPRGRHLRGGNSVYDVDVRLSGEVQPQLEVSPITKYGSDPGLVLGRQIAVNKTYICYGLKLGAIRVLNINTALRSLLKGLAQRVTDMAFFAEDVHLLAGSSVDGRVYVWKLTEGPDEEDKPQITGSIVIAVQIVGEWQSAHPRVCWHCHKQEVLVVGIGKYVLKIDTTKIGKGKKYSAEEPLVCPISKLIDGIQLVGEHDGEVTDLSMCQWMTTRLVSASVDGTIKIWEDRKLLPIAVLRPHDGQPVNSVTFLAAADRPDHIILITGGPLNREIKIWSSASEEGWLLPSDAESWTCNQTLELKSSLTRAEDSFFNQVVALPQTGLFLLANAKKNAIYAVHLDYGAYPAATRMDYIAEFTVTMPILSFTGTSSLLPHGEHIVQVYCVQTQAIQQYALDLLQCLPPPLENAAIEKSDSSGSYPVTNLDGLPMESSRNKPTEISLPTSAPASVAHDSFTAGAPSGRYPLSSLPKEPPTPQEVASSGAEVKPVPLPGISSAGISDSNSLELPVLPLSPRLSGKLSGYRSASNNFESVPSLNDSSGEPTVLENSVDRQPEPLHVNLPHRASSDDDSTNEGSKSSRDDISTNLNSPLKFKHPTHLVTPSEILMASSPSEANPTVDHKNEGDLSIKDVVNTDSRNVEVDVKVVGEKRFDQNNTDSQDKLQSFVSNDRERSFYSQASDIVLEMVRESRAVPHETPAVEEPAQHEATSRGEVLAQLPITQDEVHESVKDDSEAAVESAIPVPTQQLPTTSTKRRKQKVKNDKGSGPSSPSRSAFNSADSSFEPGVSSTIPSEIAFSQILVMQETLNQLVVMQKDMQKQLSVAVTTPVTKEGRRLEAAIGRNMEKALKAYSDGMWARFQEESSRQEKLAREQTQQITNFVSNCISKDFPAVLEKAIKKELTAVGQAVARAVVPTVEKTISTAITEAFQKGVSDKAVNQLEKSVNSKLETTVARQIQVQFQTSGKQALQEALKSSLEASVIPAFEMSCRALFEQVEATFQKGMAEHTAASQQKFESTHSSLALTLRDAINSASSLTQTLSSDLSEGHRKLLASLTVAGATPNTGHPLIRKLSNGPLPGLHEQIEAPVDPTKELSRMIAECKFEEAFTTALQRSDVYIVSWLCSQVDLQGILALNPLPLSQGVLLSLAQQLACDINNDTPRKLGWMRDVLSAVNPTDPMIVVHIRPIFEQVYQILNHHRSVPTTTPAEISSIRLLMHVINSMLMTCK